MPGFFKSFDDHRQRYNLWKNRITNINNLEIPDSFAADMSDKEKVGTYNRFNGYVKQWMLGILCGDETKRNDIHSSEFSDFNIYADTLPDNWYKRAISAANSKSKKGLPVLGTPDSKTSHNLYTKVMPAYRALKESFDKRPFWHWITRHAEYTAERDALNAIKGFTRAATGIDPKTFDNMYIDYSYKVQEPNHYVCRSGFYPNNCMC